MVMVRVPYKGPEDSPLTDAIVEQVNDATEEWCNELGAESVSILDICYVKKRPRRAAKSALEEEARYDRNCSL